MAAAMAAEGDGSVGEGLLDGIPDELGGDEGSEVAVKPVEFQQLKPSDEMTGRDNVERLLDVSLSLSVELGRKQMQIKEILDLGPGKIIELDKLAGEPVDLLVNGKLLAKGEVVVVDENFGVRITESVIPVPFRDRVTGNRMPRRKYITIMFFPFLGALALGTSSLAVPGGGDNGALNEYPGMGFDLFFSTVKVLAALAFTLVLLVTLVWVMKKLMRLRNTYGSAGSDLSGL